MNSYGKKMIKVSILERERGCRGCGQGRKGLRRG